LYWIIGFKSFCRDFDYSHCDLSEIRSSNPSILLKVKYAYKPLNMPINHRILRYVLGTSSARPDWIVFAIGWIPFLVIQYPRYSTLWAPKDEFVALTSNHFVENDVRLFLGCEGVVPFRHLIWKINCHYMLCKYIDILFVNIG
jgi:hypothetical protein